VTPDRLATRISERPSTRPLSTLVCLCFVLSSVLLALGQSTDSARRPLPDAAGLLRAVQANQKNLEAVVKNYTFNKIVTQQDTDKNGKLKKETTEEYEVFFHGPDQIERLVRKNGAPLSDAERKKEQDKIDKKIAELTKREASGKPNKPQGDVLTIDSFLRCSQFVNGRREPFREKEVVVYDFEPASHCDAQNRAEKVLGKVGGVIWVEEDDKEVVRMEVRLIEGLRVGGILASIQKGSELIFEQQKVNDEIWLPSSGEVHYGGRVLFKGFHGNIFLRYSNYKKFRVNTSITVIDGPAPSVSPEPPRP